MFKYTAGMLGYQCYTTNIYIYWNLRAKFGCQVSCSILGAGSSKYVQPGCKVARNLTYVNNFSKLHRNASKLFTEHHLLCLSISHVIYATSAPRHVSMQAKLRISGLLWLTWQLD